MPTPATAAATPAARSRISLDVWAVVLSFALALLVRFGVIGKVPW